MGNYLYQNWDLFVVGIVVVMTVIIGFIVFFGDNKSATNRSFLGLSLFTALWGTLNYLSYQSQFVIKAFSILRLTVFSVTWLLLFFLLFALSFPNPKTSISKIVTAVLVIFTSIVSILTLTPLVFEKASELSSSGSIISVTNGPLLPLFGMTTTVFALAGIAILLVRTWRAPKENKNGFLLITGGVGFMFLAVMISNFILPVLFNNPAYIHIAALFVFPFIIMTSYAIAKNNIFNVKIIGTEVFMVILLLLALFQLMQASDLPTLLIRGGILLSLIAIGVLLIGSVMREVKQREQLEILTGALEEANDKLKSLDQLKTEFLSLASHQLRSPLTAIKGYTSMLLDGSFGKVNEDQKEAIDRIFQSSNHLTKVVEDLLNVTKIEQGGMKYEMAPFDIGKSAKELTDDLSITAKKKGLEFKFKTDDQGPYMVTGDMEKLRQVLLNLIDNSIKYTTKGYIHTKLERTADNKIVFSVSDSGMGVSPEIKAALFQKFSRGEGGRINSGGAGLGLYLAKEIVEAHKGRVWVESPGKGLGATFYVELNSVVK